jgi:hypothetical protein
MAERGGSWGGGRFFSAKAKEILKTDSDLVKSMTPEEAHAALNVAKKVINTDLTSPEVLFSSAWAGVDLKGNFEKERLAEQNGVKIPIEKQTKAQLAQSLVNAGVDDNLKWLKKI